MSNCEYVYRMNLSVFFSVFLGMQTLAHVDELLSLVEGSTYAHVCECVCACIQPVILHQ